MALSLSTASFAQLSSNPDKFLGNITTRGNVEAGGGVPSYYLLWNQITCENESKWGSVEGTRGNFNWGCDRAFNYAQQHGFTYKFHALVWGSQYPNWLPDLTPKERFAAITNWFDKTKEKYNTLPMIDVVNEAVGEGNSWHQAGNPMIRESLGGGGKTGFDWLIKAFDMASQRWPDAILIYNDYNSIRWDVDRYLTLVQTLRDAGAPIDAYGNQSHEVGDISADELSNVLEKQQNTLRMPMYITELDIDKANDAQQKAQYQRVLPLMWEAPYCAGVTLWGYIHGATWVDNSGLYKNGVERPAMTWIKEYMATDEAKNAVSPFPGMKKEASIYIKPADLFVAKGDKVAIKVRASLATKTIEKVDLYVGTTPTLVATMTEAPYIAEYTTSATGWQTLKAVVTATDGSTYERYGRINVLTSTTKREPYNGDPVSLPGTIVTTQYDKGASKATFYNASRTTAVTKDDQWMEYTVDVKEKGIYSFDAEVAASKTGGRFHLSEYGFDNLDFLTDFLDVPSTGGATKYMTLHGVLKDTLTEGRHRICLNIEKGGFYIKNLTFNRYEEDKTMSVTVSSVKPATVSVGDTTLVTLTAKTATNSEKTIAKVDVYANNLLIGTLTEAPYTLQYTPTVSGTHYITAIATDSEGKVKTSAKKGIKVNGKRIPYNNGNPISLPGIIQAENFDKGGEGFTFHDSDSKNEGDASFRTDNEGLDLVKGNNGTAIGYTANGEWTEYTVNVKEPGEYSFEATCSNGSSSNGGFTINTVKGSTVTQIGKVTVTPTGGWDTYKVMTGKLTKNLAEGEQILRFTISGANCNIDKVKFICTLNTGIQTVVTAEPERTVIYNLKGQKVDANYKGIIIRNGRKILKR